MPLDPGAIEPQAEIWYPIGGRARRESKSSPTSSSTSWPVLLYSPGWDGTQIDSPAAVAALVSHGFAVVTVIYPAQPKRPMDFSSDAAFQDSLRRAGERVHARARDAIHVLDRLAGTRGESRLGRLVRRLDGGKVGIFGYSFGGAVAAQAAWMDARFKAAANIDGWQFGEAAEYGIAQPYLLMSDATPLPTAGQLSSTRAAVRNPAILTDMDHRRTLANMSRHGGIYAVLAGTTHGTIAGGNRRWPWRLLIRAGLIEPPRTQQILGTCLIEFFEQSLGLRADQPAGTWAARFPQLQVTIHAQPAAARLRGERAASDPK